MSNSRSEDSTSPNIHTIVAPDATTSAEFHESDCHEMAFEYNANEDFTWVPLQVEPYMFQGYQDANGAWEPETWCHAMPWLVAVPNEDWMKRELEAPACHLRKRGGAKNIPKHQGKVSLESYHSWQETMPSVFPQYMCVPIFSNEGGCQVTCESVQECAPASHDDTPGDEAATSTDDGAQSCVQDSDSASANATSMEEMALSSDHSTQDTAETSHPATSMTPADIPTHPPGVFFTGSPLDMYNLADSNSCTSDFMFTGEYHAVNDWWQGGNSMYLNSLSETASRAKRKNAPVYIATHLTWLETKDSDCVCIVRKIQKLGAKSTDTLREYFEQWGAVEKVLLSCEPAEGAAAEAADAGRRKSPCMGWVVMQDARDAAKALAQSLHQIGSTTIRVERFVSKNHWRNQHKAEAVDETHVEEDFDDEDLSDLMVGMAGKERARWSDMSL
jgi:hypothetical protein